MFMMSRDHLAMDLDKSSLQLMLRLLNVDNAAAGKCSTDSTEYNRIRHRLQGICNSASAALCKNRAKAIALEDIMVSTVCTCAGVAFTP